MLVLSRKKDEKIFLTIPGYDEVAITIVDIDRNRVRVGIDAPKTINVIRGELRKPSTTVH